MIPKVAVRKFLSRPRDDLRKFKNLKPQRLEHEVTKLPRKPPLWDKLRKHQKECVLLGLRMMRIAFWLDTGMGKTLLSIVLILYMRLTKQGKQYLVVVPYNVNRWGWVREIKKHSPETSYKVLIGSSANKLQKAQDTKAAIVITTYAGLARMLSKLVKKKKKMRLKVDKTKVALIRDKFDGVILDQSENIGNHSSLQYKVCKALSGAPLWLELSGTPFGRDPTPLWSQMKLVDGGQSLGETLGLFRAAFFTTTTNYWGGYEHRFRKRTQKELNRVLSHRSIHYEVDEGDLPRTIEIKKEITLPHEAQQYYDKAKAMVLAAKGDYREMKNGFVRMRQISSGFLGYYDDDAGERAKVMFNPNPKLEMLLSIIESIPNYKIIVYHDFIWSGDMISKELKERKIGYLRISGGKHSKDSDKKLEQFDNNPDKRVMLLSNAMAVGLNLQVAKYGIYYESPVSPRVRKESRRRFERQESPHKKIVLYDLVCRNTYDQRILDFHKQGKDLWEAILKGEVSV